MKNHSSRELEPFRSLDVLKFEILELGIRELLVVSRTRCSFMVALVVEALIRLDPGVVPEPVRSLLEQRLYALVAVHLVVLYERMSRQAHHERLHKRRRLGDEPLVHVAQGKLQSHRQLCIGDAEFFGVHIRLHDVSGFPAAREQRAAALIGIGRLRSEHQNRTLRLLVTGAKEVLVQTVREDAVADRTVGFEDVLLVVFHHIDGGRGPCGVARVISNLVGGPHPVVVVGVAAPYTVVFFRQVAVDGAIGQHVLLPQAEVGDGPIGRVHVDTDQRRVLAVAVRAGDPHLVPVQVRHVDGLVVGKDDLEGVAGGPRLRDVGREKLGARRREVRDVGREGAERAARALAVIGDGGVYGKVAAGLRRVRLR
ncbi:MAG: hypothetical protein ABIF82_01905 [Planctomycetota bacterium]